MANRTLKTNSHERGPRRPDVEHDPEKSELVDDLREIRQCCREILDGYKKMELLLEEQRIQTEMIIELLSLVGGPHDPIEQRLRRLEEEVRQLVEAQRAA